MDTQWTKHLKTEADRKRFIATIEGSRPVLERMGQMLTEHADAQKRIERSPKAFANPNWTYLQAYMNGYMAALDYSKKLTLPDQEETK